MLWQGGWQEYLGIIKAKEDCTKRVEFSLLAHKNTQPILVTSF